METHAPAVVKSDEDEADEISDEEAERDAEFVQRHEAPADLLQQATENVRNHTRLGCLVKSVFTKASTAPAANFVHLLVLTTRNERRGLTLAVQHRMKGLTHVFVVLLFTLGLSHTDERTKLKKSLSVTDTEHQVEL